MRNMLMCTVASLAILFAGSVGLAKEKRQRPERKETTQADKEWQQKLKEMTPAERKIAVEQKALETDLTTLRQIRNTAAEEKAPRTMALIDKAIAAKQEQAKKLAAAMEKAKAGGKGQAPGTQKQGGNKAGKKKSQ